VRQVLLRDAWALVADGQDAPVKMNVNCSPVRGELHGVVQEVGDRALEGRRLPDHVVRREAHVEVQIWPTPPGASHGSLHHLGKVQGFGGRLHRFLTAQLHKVADQ